ncbi:MAG: hypothetical protein ACOYXC_01680 [Candidatus Rifleibacteriota bacterium]
MTWLSDLTGIEEEDYESIHANLILDGEKLTSKKNGRTFVCGRLETPMLVELRRKIVDLQLDPKKTAISQIVGDVQKLHTDPQNANAVFQVASQFNLLEMVGPTVTPEQGIGIYQFDRTQGPACAIAAGAGTIFRNYFAPVNGKVGQTSDNQIDCVADLGAQLGNNNGQLWKMQNGYLLPSEAGLRKIDETLRSLDEVGLDKLRCLLRVGIQWNTEVTISQSGHLVTQVYGSAVPVSYSGLSPQLWENFARLILEASYEAAFCASILNSQQNGNKKLFLTMLGGGAFGNDPKWILAAIKRSMQLYSHHGLDVAIVSYGQASSEIQTFIKDFQ